MAYSFGQENLESEDDLTPERQLALTRARRTAFVARFIVLRESKRTRAHRVIEMMEWADDTTVDELVERFRRAFVENGDNMTPVERDIRRAFAHSQRSLNHFIDEYASRSTMSFIDALHDYERSNQLLFGNDEYPKPGGWRLPQELERAKNEE
ncbi:MAG: hypothetical protein KDD64_04420 [Bdellovibrionales bacterium]|nr:hypothetical protein [Bdellovibrionales bacterium]